MRLALTLACLAVLYLLAALFSCMETAFTSANRTLLRDQAEQGNRRASLAKCLLENTSAFFGTVLLGTNLMHVTITTLTGTVLAAAFLNTDLARKCGLTENMQSLVTSLMVTPALLLFTELLPKAIGRRHADRLTLFLAPALNLARMVLRIPVGIVSWIADGLAKMLGSRENSGQLGKVTRDDLKILAAVASEQGLIMEESGQIMASVLELNSKPIETVMVPLVEVQSLPVTATVDDVEAMAAETGYTRFPVYDNRVDEFIGLVSLRKCLFECPDDKTNKTKRTIRYIMDRNVMFVPESMTVGALLNEFHKNYMPMMFVVDEYGGVVGVVTLEDLIGLLAGGIQDFRNQQGGMVQRLSPNSFECDGRTDIRDLEKHLGFKVDNVGFETAAGLVLKLCGNIPAKDSEVQYRNHTIKILDVQKHRIVKLLFTKNTVQQ